MRLHSLSIHRLKPSLKPGTIFKSAMFWNLFVNFLRASRMMELVGLNSSMSLILHTEINVISMEIEMNKINSTP